jgi:hypothetical protein
LSTAKKPTATLSKLGSAKNSAAISSKTNSIDAFVGNITNGGTALDGSEAFAASGLDDAIDLLEITTKGTDAVRGNNNIEKHPERRMKSAWAAFEEREMPILKSENPGLRLSQLSEWSIFIMLYLTHFHLNVCV